MYLDCEENLLAIVNLNVNQMYEYLLYHKNQHMILDTCGTECLTVDLGLGSDTSDTTRTLDIRVIFFMFLYMSFTTYYTWYKEPILIYYNHFF